jgi:hypothetical protein
MRWSLRLLDEAQVLDQPVKVRLQAILEAERRLLLFSRWLARSYVSSTVFKYVSDVKALQRSYNGVPLAALGVAFHRLPILFRAMRREAPGGTREEKAPWEVGMFEQQREGQGAGSSCGLFADSGKGRAKATAFEKATVDCVQALAFEQLLRLSELVRTGVATNAETYPLTWGDVEFLGAGGHILPWSEQGEPLGCPVLLVLRMPPSKKDRIGTGELRCPFPEGWQEGAALNAAGPKLWRYARRYPVARNKAAVTPLFREKEGKKGAPVSRLSKSRFTRAFNVLCREASPPIVYSQFGIHCFRVGGMNRLMDLGATAPQICALGRWSSDCWQLYARRQRKQLVNLTARMSMESLRP